jgi:Holliday junction resolvase RusA-like endonuclease
MTSITITLPLPDRKLSPNARCHWRAKAPVTKQHRRAAGLKAWETLANQPPPHWKLAKMQVKAYFPTKRFPDFDNFGAMLKAYRDGLEDAGIIENDKGLRPDCPEFFKDAEKPRVEITITPIE